ncbi:MAG: vanadium-dependent haloperoxidase, partial [Pseudomonadota bacterium]
DMSTTDQSIVAQWNELALEAIREGSAKPTATIYQLHLASAAVYDAWATFDEDAYGYYSEIETGLARTEENKAEAVSFAAYASLVELFPDQADGFEAFLVELGYDPQDATAGTSSAAGVGALAAQNVFDARANDGSNAENDFADTSGYAPVNSADPTTGRTPGGQDFDPNHWQPLRVPNGTLTDQNGVPIFDDNDPSTYNDQVALTPHWGNVESFAMAENDQFRPDAPPQLGDFSVYVDGAGNVTTNDQAYRDQVTEVLNVSADLTTEQKVVAELWADGPRTESPPGHWNQIAQDIALREGHGIDEDAKLFFALNAAVFDAGIATWEAKYAYDYIRPQSAIRDLYFGENVMAWGGVNQGSQQILGQEWQPYQNVTFVTPPFPEYVSGHSAFSMAAANTIASFVGSDVYYDGTSLSNYDLDGVAGIDLLGQYETNELAFEDFGAGPPVVLRWNTLTEAALEAGISRIYGGIHIQDGNLNGLKVGEAVA